MQLSIVTVTQGPGKLAYRYADGELHIWTGDYVSEAPADSNTIEIAPDCTSWYIRDTVEEPSEP